MAKAYFYLRKAFVFGIVFICFSATAAFAAEVEADSHISDVTVYPNAALIQRAMSLDLPAGSHRVMIKDVVARIDENSLSVSGSGSAKVKIFGAQIKREYLPRAAGSRVRELEQKIETVADAIAQANNHLQALDEQKAFLDSVRLFSGQQIPKDLVTEMPSVDELKGVLDFLGNQTAAIAKTKDEVRIKIRELSRERDALARELNEIRNLNQQMQRVIVVDIECLKAGTLNLNVSFLVYGVQWYPIYDARVAFDAGQVELISSAMIKQSTGEDWNGVELTISTARPSISGQMPELDAWYLNPAEYGRHLKGKMTEDTALSAPQMFAVVGGTEVKSSERRDAQEEAQTVYAEAQLSGANVTYKISKPVTIKADGSDHRVGISAQILPAQFRYASTPKLSPYAYLKSRVSNDTDGPLLPGSVNIFLDGGFVGKSQIEKALGPKEEFDLYLGADESVTVKRELLDKKTDETFLGGIPSPNKTIVYKYKLTVENYKKKPISLSLFDQVPISQNDKIRIKNIQFKPEPADKNYQDRQGVARWVLDLAPQEKKSVELSFTIEHPREMVIYGL